MNMHAGRDASVVFQNITKPISMLRERTAIVILLFPILVWMIADGGWFFTVAVAIVLALAAKEFGQLFQVYQLRPSIPLLILGTLGLSIARFMGGLELSVPVLTIVCLLAMSWHLVDFELGAPRSGSDFTITITGIIYVGWIGSYLISIRSIPDGKWWFLIALPSVWLADTAAYFVGSWIGKHKLSPRLSPKKSWEGYLAGILAGAISGILFALLWRIGAGKASTVTPLRGLVVGGVLAILAPLGDLGVSMIKREIQVKDTGNLLPGHGGALDRLDTWIWAGVLGFYFISWLTS
jgi:phosphatidate cytidylyltransferase